MAAESYRVLFDGQISEGRDLDEVKAHLARLFSRSAADIESLFSGKPRVLKTVHRFEDGQRFLAALAKAGAVARLESPPVGRTSGKDGKVTGAILEPAGFRYRVNITGAALVIGILWLVHFTLLASLSAALVYHLFWNLGFYAAFGLGGVLLHALPALMGAAVIAVLIKPLLPVHGRTASMIILKPGQEVRLEELLNEVCEQVDAPVPHRIAVDSGAGMTLDFGALPEFPARRPTLRLGLTLIGGMSIRQFAGLLGREVGYSGRKQAARRTRFVRASHQRLQQAVYGDDKVDRLLKELKNQSSPVALLGRRLWKLLVLSRRSYRGLLKIATAVSSGPLELQQARLDTIQARLSGSQAFRGTLAMHHLLEMAFKAAADQEEHKWKQKGELAARLPAVALSLAREQAKRFQAEISKVMQGGVSGTNDICPTDLKRIERIEKNPHPGLKTDERPTRQLLSDFDYLSRRGTYLYYRSRLLEPITPDLLLPNTVEPSSAERLLRGFFLDLHRSPLPLNQPLPEGNPATLREKLRDAVTRSKAERVGSQAILQYYFEIDRQLIAANAREVLVTAKIQMPEGKVDLESIHRKCRELEDEDDKTLKKLRESAQAPSQRLAIGLALLKRYASGSIPQEIERLRAALRRTDEVLPKLRTLHMHSTMLELLLSYGSSRNHLLHEHIDECARDVRQLLLAIRINLREAPWPFGATVPGDSMAKHAFKEDFHEADPSGLLDIANGVLSRTEAIRQQVLVRLVQLALSAEKRLLGN